MNFSEKIDRLTKNRSWSKEPVFCFTSDIDWASEEAMKVFLDAMDEWNIKLNIFVTHDSKIISEYHAKGKVDLGIHPNFLPESSHGHSFREVIDTCLKWAPGANGFRSHRYFDVNDINEIFYKEYNFKYSSNICTTLQPGIKPLLHRSGLIQFPIFFEDGGFLYNKLELNINSYKSLFETPGLKIINLHPMNYVVNPPTIEYMRKIKDTTSREVYNIMSKDTINEIKFKGTGITNVCEEIFEFSKNHLTISLPQLYQMTLD